MEEQNINMCLIKKDEIIIDREEYDFLKERSIYLGMFYDAMMENSYLAYDGKSLRIDGDEIAVILKRFTPIAYQERIKILQAEKEAEKGEKNE